MKEEFNLSEKLGHDWEGEFIISNDKDIDDLLRKEDVKEFIRRLKEITKDCMSGGCEEEKVMERIDKLAGEKLI